ncbi:hypothetical protein IG631_23948 [Alternaria alternata]|nr:hypothetical protein IG631_23948 [Alternaria alternata]
MLTPCMVRRWVDLAGGVQPSGVGAVAPNAEQLACDRGSGQARCEMEYRTDVTALIPLAVGHNLHARSLEDASCLATCRLHYSASATSSHQPFVRAILVSKWLSLTSTTLRGSASHCSMHRLSWQRRPKRRAPDGCLSGKTTEIE